MDALVREIQVLGHRRVRETDEIIDLLQLMWEFEQGVLRPVLMVEYANCGTLAEFLQSGRAAPWQAKAVLCGDVIKGLAALHEIGVVHGDIKCDNVLVCMEEKDGRPQAKLTDFGFSIFLAELEPGARCSVPGTQPFCAPEASKSVERDGLAYTDYFSLGMLVWQVLLEGKEDLFSQLPFECPSRMTSESAWSDYIQSAKQKDGFVDNVKSSILLAHDFGEPWDHFSIILDNTLNLIPAQRNMEEVLALHGFA
jgi:serine/threonine protein kinase